MIKADGRSRSHGLLRTAGIGLPYSAPPHNLSPSTESGKSSPCGYGSQIKIQQQNGYPGLIGMGDTAGSKPLWASSLF